MKYLFLGILFLFISFNAFSQENYRIGDTIPEFKLWLTDGSKLTKNDILNKIVVFKFWFTSCLPCLTDIPLLNNLVNEYKKRDDILFVAPALERKELLNSFLQKNNFKFKTAYSAMDVSQLFNKKQVYPSYFVINKKGEFTYIDSGTKKSEISNLKKAIAAVLLKK